MKRFQNILVAVDSRLDVHPALQWALSLARHNHAKLTIVDVLPELSWIAKMVLTDCDKVQEALAEQKKRLLDGIATPAREEGIDVSTRILEGKTSFAIMHEVLRSGHDLVVRVTKGGGSDRTGFFGTTSLRLLRKCPCAVWLVPPTPTPCFKKVLAAIDPAPRDANRVGLSRTIMELGQSVANYENGELHVVNAWEFFRGGHSLKSKYKSGEFAEVQRKAETSIASALDAFLEPYGMTHSDDNIHLICNEMGASYAISDTAKQEEVDLVVMGTIGHTGLKGALLGNTAERVLERIECALLAVKPNNFVSPVTLPDG